MRLGPLMIFLWTMMAISAVSALTLSEQINVRNGGVLYAQTNSVGAGDKVVGMGDQNYSRTLDVQGDKSRLTSEYTLRSAINEGEYLQGMLQIGGQDSSGYFGEGYVPRLRFNRYSVQMDSPGGLNHFVNLRSSSDILAKNSITHDNNIGEVSTNYQISSGWGDLYEEITKPEVNKVHPKYLAESGVMGQFDFQSSLSDSEARTALTEFDLQSMKLDSVKAIGETGIESINVPLTRVVVGNEMATTESFVTGERKVPILANNTVISFNPQSFATREAGGLVGEPEPGETAEQYFRCNTTFIALGSKGKLCRIPYAEVGRTFRTDGYFRG